MVERRRIEVGALARVEGEGALHLVLEGDRVVDLRLEIYEPPRFFEALARGRRADELPDLMARICGICPVAYQMSAVHAIEAAWGVAHRSDRARAAPALLRGRVDREPPAAHDVPRGARLPRPRRRDGDRAPPPQPRRARAAAAQARQPHPDPARRALGESGRRAHRRLPPHPDARGAARARATSCGPRAPKPSRCCAGSRACRCRAGRRTSSSSRCATRRSTR